MTEVLAPTAALELRGIASGYDRTVVLRDLSLLVPASSVVALLGPNGAGKSTLLKTASGLLRPTQGSVLVNGQDVTRMKPHARVARGLCHIPEGRAVYRSLSVRDNLVMQSRRGDEDGAVQRATEAFPVLGKRLRQLAGSLSGGEQQMLAMASAYVREPSLLLVDEPSLGLAPLIVDEIFRFLHDVSLRGTALLIVDQYVKRALELADKAYVLTRGELAFEGTPDELLAGDVFERYLA